MYRIAIYGRKNKLIETVAESVGEIVDTALYYSNTKKEPIHIEVFDKQSNQKIGYVAISFKDRPQHIEMEITLKKGE